jgi:pimeloyl-ACP methyl ester carboxylesterase
MWQRLVDVLAERYRVVTYENWGVGHSGCPRGPHTIERMAGDAGAVLAAAGIHRSHVLGLGMGGLVAQELALTNPDRVEALVLASTGCPGGPDEKGLTGGPLHSLPISAFVGMDRDTMYGPLTPDTTVEADRATLRSTPVSATGLKAQASAVASYRSFDRVVEITAPTLVVHGDLDRVVPLAKAVELAERVPDAELMVAPATGHNLSAPYARPVGEAIATFLDETGFSYFIPSQAS